MTDLTNIMYRHTDAVEKLSKIKADVDKQLVESMQQIKDLAGEREHQAKELAGLKVVAQVVIDMVEDGGPGDRSLVERLHEAPQRIASFLSKTSKQYMVHILGLVKSHPPGANLTPVGDGLAEGCSDEKFAEYVEEVKPIAKKIIDILDQPSDGEA